MITSPSNRRYVGSAIDIDLRWDRYKRLDCKNQTKLYRSFNKYGVDKHNFEIIWEICDFNILPFNFNLTVVRVNCYTRLERYRQATPFLARAARSAWKTIPRFQISYDEGRRYTRWRSCA